MLICLATMLSGCVSAPKNSAEAICSGTQGPRTDLAGALAADGGPMSQKAGRGLIQRLDEGCAK